MDQHVLFNAEARHKQPISQKRGCNGGNSKPWAQMIHLLIIDHRTRSSSRKGIVDHISVPTVPKGGTPQPDTNVALLGRLAAACATEKRKAQPKAGVICNSAPGTAEHGEGDLRPWIFRRQIRSTPPELERLDSGHGKIGKRPCRTEAPYASRCMYGSHCIPASKSQARVLCMPSGRGAGDRMCCPKLWARGFPLKAFDPHFSQSRPFAPGETHFLRGLESGPNPKKYVKSSFPNRTLAHEASGCLGWPSEPAFWKPGSPWKRKVQADRAKGAFGLPESPLRFLWA